MDAIKTTLPKPATKKLLCPKCRRNSPAHTFKDRRCLACQVGAWLATP